MTRDDDSVSIVQESGGLDIVTVFERGRILSEIEKPRPIGPDPGAAARFYRLDATAPEEPGES